MNQSEVLPDQDRRISFVVPGEPVEQPRHRHGVQQRGMRVRSQLYIPKDHPVHAFKQTVKLYAKQAYRDRPLVMAIAGTITFVMPRPKDKIWKRKPMPRHHHTAKPDIDNLQKSLFDALTGLLWRDDTQLVDLRVRKVVAAGNEDPHTEVEFCAAEGAEWKTETGFINGPTAPGKQTRHRKRSPKSLF